jgi:hypothetical protein
MRHAFWFAGVALAVALTLAVPWAALARGSGVHGGRHSSSSWGRSYSHRPSSSAHSRSHIKCVSCLRDSHGRIKRDPKAVEQFKRTHTRPAAITARWTTSFP